MFVQAFEKIVFGRRCSKLSSQVAIFYAAAF